MFALDIEVEFIVSSLICEYQAGCRLIVFDAKLKLNSSLLYGYK